MGNMEIDSGSVILNAWICESCDIDSIIGSVIARTNDLREELGDLNLATAPIATVIYDILTAMKLPRGAIRLALGAEMDVIDDRGGDDVPCYCCAKPAVGMRARVDGCGWHLVCEDHAKTGE